MNINSVAEKGSKYLARQAKDIEIYGEKKVIRTSDVKEEVLEVFTPHRRLSKKPCKLSDNEYFLDKFEKTTQQELPLQNNWDKLSVEEKIDYIVKGRYKRLLANKIMNAIKQQPVEHNFMLSENGEIIAHNIGNSYSTNIENAIKMNDKLIEKRALLEKKKTKFAHIESEVGTTTIHNHPSSYDDYFKERDPESIKIFEEVFGIKPEIENNPFSTTDILGYMERWFDGFVIDCQGHKFHFIPKPREINTVEQYEDFELVLNKFEYMAKSIKAKFSENYYEEKDALCKLVASGNYNAETLKMQQARVLKTYADMIKENLTSEEYRKLLTSDFVKENIGCFREI